MRGSALASQVLDVLHWDALAQQVDNAGDVKRMTRELGR